MTVDDSGDNGVDLLNSCLGASMEALLLEADVGVEVARGAAVVIVSLVKGIASAVTVMGAIVVVAVVAVDVESATGTRPGAGNVNVVRSDLLASDTCISTSFVLASLSQAASDAPCTVTCCVFVCGRTSSGGGFPRCCWMVWEVLTCA
jgi:hypothetical protein